MKTLTRYTCDICHREYPSARAAAICEREMGKPTVRPGDIVFVGAGFGWYDGDREWVSNPDVKLGGIREHGNCFGECCTYRFYYVVTAVDRDLEPAWDGEGHRWRYHLATKAMTGKHGHTGGYTYDVHHVKPKLVKRPPTHVVETSKDLIGRKSENLL